MTHRKPLFMSNLLFFSEYKLRKLDTLFRLFLKAYHFPGKSKSYVYEKSSFQTSRPVSLMPLRRSRPKKVRNVLDRWIYTNIPRTQSITRVTFSYLYENFKFAYTALTFDVFIFHIGHSLLRFKDERSHNEMIMRVGF